MSDNRPVLSGPRQPADFAVSSSFPPPAPRLNPNRPQWAVDPPFSQSRAGCYISPDISPTTPLHEQQMRGYPLPSLVHRAPADFNRRSSEGAQYWRPPGIFHPRQEDTGAYHEVGQTTMQKHRKGRAPKKAEGKQPTFLTKLYS